MMHSRRSNNAKTPNNNPNSNSASLETPNYYEGESLNNLLQSIRRGVESARHLDGSSLPEKIWIKQQFAIGVNDVTRVLERMKPCAEFERSAQLLPSITSNHKTSSVKLQAVLVASDCNPRWLTKHLQSLASSRSVPLIFVKDNKEGSLRLGELVKLKTAIAIGIKVRLKETLLIKLLRMLFKLMHIGFDLMDQIQLEYLTIFMTLTKREMLS
ncbi:unnamed protein product [Trifolium pratense]|uniref:Uncharacterized protein n=1 Tax=Trifolium pratense TaxID=57577 RepID=A0ACB0M5W4_TRIPR|nr:unnamed protein product [Trifolium pratense]